jgi:hypothetical protein
MCARLALLDVASASDQLHWTCSQCIDSFSILSIHGGQAPITRGRPLRQLYCLGKKVARMRWLAALDEFRNWLALGLQPAKAHENRPRVRMAPAGAARSNRASGAVEAEQLFDPERA